MCLLVACEHTLDRAVLDVVALQDGKLYGVADAVVGTQCGALGCEPFAVDIGLYGVLAEVEVHVNQLVAHHVHVALQDDGLLIFVAFGGRLSDNHVAGFVHFRFQSVAFAEVFQILNHLFLVLGRAGNGIDFSELLEYACGF